MQTRMPHGRSTHLLHGKGGSCHLFLPSRSLAVGTRLVLGVAVVAVQLITAFTFGSATFEAEQTHTLVLCFVVLGRIEEFPELPVPEAEILGCVLQTLHQGERLVAHALASECCWG